MIHLSAPFLPISIIPKAIPNSFTLPGYWCTVRKDDTAVLSKPYNRDKIQEFQYQEESDFAQGYDAIIQVKSNVLITHKYVDGNWTFLSAEQTDFNTTLIEVADDYSKIIADAWIRRLPSRKEFTDQKDLFSKIPPNKRY